MINDYENAEYYDACESESLTHDTPSAAIEYRLDQLYVPGESILDAIRSACPIEVVGYRRKEIPAAWLDGLAIPDFYADDEDALADIERCAKGVTK